MVLEKKFILLVLLFLVMEATLDLDLTQFNNSETWSLIMLHVKFDNNWCNGFREKVVLRCLNMLFLGIGIGAK